MADTVRVIARLDIKGPNLIKGLQFDGYRVLGTAEEFAEIYGREGIDELIYQDAVASLYRRNSLLDIVRRTAEKVFLPLTVAGGIRSVEDVRQLLRAGADKVAINTAAVENPRLLAEAAREFGSQCIVSSIEAYRGDDGKGRVWVDYGRQATGLDAVEWARKVEECGVGEILLTSIRNDGMGRGYDLDLVREISSRVGIPVIACGGAGRREDFPRPVLEAGAAAVAAASIFHYQYARPKAGKATMQFAEKRLRLGEDVDSGNIDFLNEGYGGMKFFMVEPCSIAEAKAEMRRKGLSLRS